MLVKLDHFPKDRDENKENWNHHHIVVFFIAHMFLRDEGETRNRQLELLTLELLTLRLFFCAGKRTKTNTVCLHRSNPRHRLHVLVDIENGPLAFIGVKYPGYPRCFRPFLRVTKPIYNWQGGARLVCAEKICYSLKLIVRCFESMVGR